MQVLTVDSLPDDLKDIKVINSVVATGVVAIESNKGILPLLLKGNANQQTVHTIMDRLIEAAIELGGNIIYGLKIESCPIMISKQQYVYYTISGTVASL